MAEPATSRARGRTEELGIARHRSNGYVPESTPHRAADDEDPGLTLTMSWADASFVQKVW